MEITHIINKYRDKQFQINENKISKLTLFKKKKLFVIKKTEITI